MEDLSAVSGRHSRQVSSDEQSLHSSLIENSSPRIYIESVAGSIGEQDDFKASSASSPPKNTWSSIWLLLGISVSWVGVAQLARAAQQVSHALQSTSISYLMTWANAAAWMVLAVPHAIRKNAEVQASSYCDQGRQVLSADVFQVRHTLQFMGIALCTNYCYIGALQFLAASLNTALFCASPVFTLLFSVIWLSESDPNRTFSMVSVCRAVCSWQALCVLLSVTGVIFIAEPWQVTASDTSPNRWTGTALSLAAAVGTSIYQVYFKATFGDRMKPDEVGLFLAYMGASTFAVCGLILAVLIASGVYPLQLDLVPWSLVFATSASSAIFNFLIKFGLSRDSPVAVSLATQVGIPLNLMVDVLVVQAKLAATQIVGIIIMLAAFSVQRGSGRLSSSAAQNENK